MSISEPRTPNPERRTPNAEPRKPDSERGSALIVFAKVPEPGKVKTRLTELLSPVEAALLYEAFLRDALAQYESLDVDVRLYLSPSNVEMPDEIVPEGAILLKQQGKDLGARMSHAFLETFVSGYMSAVIVGTDHPTLPAVFVQEAVRQLYEPDTIVIGPSEDGGYYLLGMNGFYPSLFADMTYSHHQVLDHTLERMSRLPVSAVVLPVWYDIDTPETLARLVGDLAAEPTASVPATRAVLAQLTEAHPELLAG